MCLDYLDIVVHEKYAKKTFGWKVFEKNQGILYGRTWNCRTPLPVGKWLKEHYYRPDKSKSRRNLNCGGLLGRTKPYPTGWHIYLTRQAARKLGIPKKVLFRNPVAWGKQDGCPIVVAKEIFIEQEQEA